MSRAMTIDIEDDVLAALRSDNEHVINFELRRLITLVCGRFGNAEGIACLYIAYQGFAENGGTREGWLRICARVFDESMQIKVDA